MHRMFEQVELAAKLEGCRVEATAVLAAAFSDGMVRLMTAQALNPIKRNGFSVVSTKGSEAGGRLASCAEGESNPV